MKKFFKDNSYNIVKMIINQLGMTIFGFIVVSAASQMSTTLGIAASVFAVLFYWFLLYYMTYEIGQKDGIKIEAGRFNSVPLKGMYMSLVANSINILFGALAFVGRLCITNMPIGGGVTEGAAPSWAASMYAIGDQVSGVLQFMYRGIVAFCITENAFAALVIPFFAVIVCTLAYLLGCRYHNGFLPQKKKEQPSDGKKRYINMGDDINTKKKK